MSSSVESQPNRASGGRRTTVLASRPLLGYRTVDLVSAAMLGVAFGVVFWAWSLVYNAPAAALYAVFPPLTALLAGPWLLAGVVAGLLVRRPAPRCSRRSWRRPCLP